MSVGPSSFSGEIRYRADGTYVVDRGGPAAREASAGLPCLYRNNSIEEGEGEVQELPLYNRLTGANKRTAHAMQSEIRSLAGQFGIERLGLMTLTFPDHVTCRREAQRRFNSLATNVLKKRFRRAIVAWERHVSGRWHVHCLVVLDADIRAGINFAEIERRNYKSANPALRREWSYWRSITNYDGKHPNHPYATFGRTEILPVKSTAEAIARYVGKYISKNVAQRREEDKGARNVSWIGFTPGTRTWNSRFSWATAGSALWRAQLRSLAELIGAEGFDDFHRILGHRWAFYLARYITELPISLETLARHFVSPSLADGNFPGESGRRSGAEIEPAPGVQGVADATGQAEHGRSGHLVPVGADGVAVDLVERAEVMARIRYELERSGRGALPLPGAFPSREEWEAMCEFENQRRELEGERRAARVEWRRFVDTRNEEEEAWTELKKRRQWWKVGT